MAYLEEFENYRADKWWWFAAYLDLAASISADPKLSAKNTDFSDVVKEYITAMEEYERQKRRSLYVLYGVDD